MAWNGNPPAPEGSRPDPTSPPPSIESLVRRICAAAGFAEAESMSAGDLGIAAGLLHDRLRARPFEQIQKLEEEARASRDLEGALREDAEREHERAERLLSAIRQHHSQKADDRCVEDDDRLYEAAGLPPCDRRVGDKEAMLANCARFIEKRCEGGGWPSYAELESQIEMLKESSDWLRLKLGVERASKRGITGLYRGAVRVLQHLADGAWRQLGQVNEDYQQAVDTIVQRLRWPHTVLHDRLTRVADDLGCQSEHEFVCCQEDHPNYADKAKWCSVCLLSDAVSAHLKGATLSLYKESATLPLVAGGELLQHRVQAEEHGRDPSRALPHDAEDREDEGHDGEDQEDGRHA